MESRQPAPEERYPAPGTSVGKYAIEALIGEGGMGAVLKARHVELDEPVAIKCLLPEMMDRADIVARFLREARSAVKLKGEHVARVLDVGKLETGAPYIVMEYLDGIDLSVMIHRQGPLRPGLAVDLLLQACEALAEAHALGIIHRDIKSANCFITQPLEGRPILKILDFGIATAPEGHASSLTTTETVVGTPGCMAPEQMRAARTADERSDIWSLGVLLYELLEGLLPFREEIYSALCLAIGMDPPVPMQRAPAAIRPIVMRCLEKEPDRRYQTVAQLAQELTPFASDAAAARASAEHCARLLRRSSPRGSRPSIDVTPIPARDERVTVANRNEAAIATELVRPSPRRRLPFALALVAATAVGIGIVFVARYLIFPKPAPERAPIAATAPGSAVPPAPTPAPTPAPVMPEPQPGEPAVASKPDERAIDPGEVDPPAAPSAKPAPKVARKSSLPPRTATAPSAITREKVEAAFRSVGLEYEVFKRKYGGRLDPDWARLNEDITFRLRDNLDAAHAEIKKFRAKLHE